MVTSCLVLFAQTRSTKRGMCWDEKTQALSNTPIEKMAPGVSWIYNWGVAPTGSATNIGQGEGKIAFLPMCWNGSFNETTIRNYLSQHQGEVKYLLAFNEPNLSWNVGGAQMTPQQAADAWPKVKQIAKDYGLEIVAPALNFTGDKVGDRIWEPFAWYDEFFRLVPESDIDYLAFHSYMNWYSAVNWVATEYFYTDKENNDLFSTTNRAKYPNLVSFMENYKTANGHFPRMFLTEFCSWEGDKDGYVSSINSQIDQMTQKLQKLEKSDLVAGYAWFMGNMSQAPSVYPYNSVFQSNTASSQLSDLGKVYVYMSTFDTEKWYNAGETILAKDYIDASMDNQQPKIRPNTETGSDIPLQVEWQTSSWTAYQVNLPVDGTYTLTLHMKSTAANDFRIYENALGAANKRFDSSLPSTNGVWSDVTKEVSLKAGLHTYLLYNMGSSSILVNSIQFDSPASGISSLNTHQPTSDTPIYNLAGQRVSSSYKGIVIKNGKKVVIK